LAVALSFVEFFRDRLFLEKKEWIIMMSANWVKFIKELNKVKHKRATALVLFVFIGALTLALSGLLLYGVLDWLLALPQMFRLVLSLSFAGIIVIFFCVRVIKILNLGKTHTARLIDKVMQNKRSEILSAYELGSSDDKNGIRGFFIEQVIDEALKKMEILSWNKYYPKRETFHSIRLLFTVLVLSCLVYVIFPAASTVIFKRIVSPFEDIPPFSQYVFKILPVNPKVIYGGKLELTAEISGAEIKSQVLFVTRSAKGIVHETPCFKLGKNKFAQKVERINESIDFCFKTGRARSHWGKINLLLQPRISMVKIKIQAPAYSMLPDKNFFTGIDILKELKGTRIGLTITSNRPLKSGYLKLITEDMGKDQLVQGTKTSSHSVVFNWTLKEAAELKFYIEDVLGTKCQKPLKIKQYLQKDEIPQIMIQEPVGFIMATPDSVIDFRVTAEDDLGIKQIDIIRSISGFRDRVKALDESYEGKAYEFDGKLDLKGLGTSPGEDIEFYFEAFDYNPALTGVASSELVKVKLISQKEYAKLLRMKSSIRELEARYNLIGIKLFEFKKTLDQFVNDLKKGKLSNKAKAAYIKKLQKAFADAQEVIRKFAEDFAIYDIEKKHKKTITKILQKLEKSKKTINTLKPSFSNKILLDKLKNILTDAEQNIQANQEIQKDAKLLALLELFFKETGKFKALVENQKNLVKKLSVYKTNSSAERLARLSDYSSQEAELLTKYKNILNKLKDIAFKLPISEYDLSTHIEKFIDIAGELKIKGFLEKTVEYAKFKNGDRAYHFAALALEKMFELLNDKKNQTSSTCRGNSPGCLSQELQKTASQMLNSLLNKQGQGSGNSSGSAGGGGGDTNDGFFGEGASSLNIPVIGPNRHSPSSKANSSGRGGHEGKAGRGRSFKGENINRENINISKRTKTRTESINLDQVPLKYRKAVKKYFGDKK
jgi:hypothetical protein